MSNPKIVLLHAPPRWLTPTQNWLYTQIQSLSPKIENHIVVCREPENLDLFSHPNIHSLADGLFWKTIQSNVDRFQKKSHKPLKPPLTQDLPKLLPPNPVNVGKQTIKDLLTTIRQYPCSSYVTKTIKKNKVQVLHSHFGYIGWRNIRAVKTTGAKHVVTFYGQDVTQFPKTDSAWNGRYLQLFENVSHVLCEGPFMAQSIVDLGCPPEKVKVHHLGINVGKITFQTRIWREDEPLKILIAASFREKKGIPYALEALGQLNPNFPLEITIVGDATNEPRSQLEKQKILTIINKYNMLPNTRLLGFQPHSVLLEEAYKHHIFLSPSVTASDGDSEGGAPVSIIEMIATGMPVVSTTHCDIPNVIQPQLRHLLAPERDVKGLLNALNWLIVHRSEWNGILQDGREYIEENFSATTQAKRLETIYRSVLK